MAYIVNFSIYQLDVDNEFCFTCSDWWKAKNKRIDLKEYECVYHGKIESDETESTAKLLNRIYEICNAEHPDDYMARSVSVSDIIKLRIGGDIKTYFVDDFGFKRIELCSVYDFED